MPIRSRASAALLVLAAACASVEGETAASLEGVPVVSFDSLFRRVDSVPLVTPAEEAIGITSGIVVLGRAVILSDATRGNLKVFSKQGRLVRIIGKPGDGPGEFRMPMGVIQDGQGHLVVYDLKRNMLSTWDTSGTLLTERVMAGTFDGLAAVPGSDHVILVGARVAKGKEQGVDGEHMMLHDVDSTGAIGASYHSFRWPKDPLQSTFSHYFATSVGNLLVTGGYTTNRVYYVDRRTGKERSALLGGPWYRAPNWTELPPAHSAMQRVTLWAKQQILLVRLFGIDDQRFLAEFRSYTPDGEERYQYVLANTAGQSLVSTLPTRLRILLVSGETAYGVSTTAEGDASLETLRLTIPARN